MGNMVYKRMSDTAISHALQLPPSSVKQGNWRNNLKTYLSTIADSPIAPSEGFKQLDAVGEEYGLLASQRLGSRLSAGLTNRPNFHIQDRIVGGIPGAVTGGVVDHKMREHDNSGLDIGGRLAAILGGTYLGGKSLNTTMNVGRRYIAETAPIFNYSLKAKDQAEALGKKDRIKSLLQDLWRYGVKGERRADIDDMFQRSVDAASGLGRKSRRAAIWEAEWERETAKGRAELLRRYLGVHTDDIAKDFFVRRPDLTYGFNKHVVKPGNVFYDRLIKDTLKYKGIPDAANPPRYSSDTSNAPFQSLFGSHDMRLNKPLTQTANSIQGDYTVGDAWNLAIDPGESDIRQYLSGLARTSPLRWKEYLNRPMSTATEESIRGISGTTIGDRLRSAGTRQLMESVFRQHTPVVQQNMRVSYPKSLAKQPRDYTRFYETDADFNTPVQTIKRIDLLDS